MLFCVSVFVVFLIVLFLGKSRCRRQEHWISHRVSVERSTKMKFSQLLISNHHLSLSRFMLFFFSISFSLSRTVFSLCFSFLLQNFFESVFSFFFSLELCDFFDITVSLCRIVIVVRVSICFSLQNDASEPDSLAALTRI